MILEDGNRSYSFYPKCDMFVSQQELNGRHPTTAFCQRDKDRKRQCLATEEVYEGAVVALTNYDQPLMAVPPFKYLGRVLFLSDYDCPAVIWNLRRMRQKRARLSQVIGWEEEDAQMSGMLYTAVFQAVLLYRLESWVMPPRIGKALGIFHHHVMRRLTGRTPNWGGDRTWI